MLLAKLIDVAGRRHHIHEQFLAVRVHDPNDLEIERVERNPVIAAVRGHQRDRGSAARLDDPHRARLPGPRPEVGRAEPCRERPAR